MNFDKISILYIYVTYGLYLFIKLQKFISEHRNVQLEEKIYQTFTFTLDVRLYYSQLYAHSYVFHQIFFFAPWNKNSMITNPIISGLNFIVNDGKINSFVKYSASIQVYKIFMKSRMIRNNYHKNYNMIQKVITCSFGISILHKSKVF